MDFFLTKIVKLISVISMLSSDPPDTSSPANVDAAKQVREDITSPFFQFPHVLVLIPRIPRRLQEESSSTGSEER